jgi:hypothetical protein
VADLGSNRKGEVDSFGILHRLRLPLVAVVFCLLGSVLSWPWSMVSALVAIIILLIAMVGMLRNYFKKRKRLGVLKEPFEVRFLIPQRAKYNLPYVQQDEEEHYVDTLILPRGSTSVILVSLRSKLDFEVDMLAIGCPETSDSKPVVSAWMNPLITRGVTRISPDTNPNHIVDWFGYYQIRNMGWKLNKGEIRSLGFEIKTADKGTFPLKIRFHSPEGQGQAILTIRVE